MRINQVSQSAKIYIDQILNYIQKGQGYQQIRSHLLKQLNQIDADNPSSDDTLIPYLIQRLRVQMISQDTQIVSRTIDILEDLIKYADEVIQSYICEDFFCLSLSIAANYKKLISLRKAIHQQNRTRLCSIILYYFEKFQKDPSRYSSIFKIYKQLKEKNCQFPNKTYIVIPKKNEFKKKLKKQLSDNSSQQSDRVGVTFDSIIQFMNECQSQFNKNKASCANTEFVRALKIKAKTLYDLSVSNDSGIVLNQKQKQEAKVLYKKIRTMLKQIDKISQERIKQSKIKSQKEFAIQKIEHMTPNKNKQTLENLRGSNKSVKSPPNEKNNLLDDEQTSIVSNNKAVSPINITKTSSLLDDQPQLSLPSHQSDDNDLLGIQVVKPKSNQKSQKRQIKLPKPPKYQNLLDNQQAKQQTLLDNMGSTPKKESLIEQVAIKGDFSRKSIHSQGRQSIYSQQSDTGIKNSISSKGQSLKDSPDNLGNKTNGNNLEFGNEHLFSRFEIINQIKDPNNYNTIPNDIDFSDKSSQSNSQAQNNRVTFNTNQYNNQFFDDDKQDQYDSVFRTPTKQTSYQQKQDKNKNADEKLSLSANIVTKKVEQLIPDYNFGILADIRQVKAYNYDKYNKSAGKSSIGSAQDDGKLIDLTSEPIKMMKSFKSAQQLELQRMDFGQSPTKVELLDEDEDFQDYQKGENIINEIPNVFNSQKQLKSKSLFSSDNKSSQSPNKINDQDQLIL